MSKSYNLVWFREDLRIRDNPALYHALDSDLPIIALYIFYPEQWKKHSLSQNKFNFIYQTLEKLKNNLTYHHIPLLVRSTDLFDNTPKIFEELLKKISIKKVFFNLEYPINEQTRDLQIKKFLKNNQIEVASYHDQIILNTEKLYNTQKEPYKVFSAFKRVWLKELENSNNDQPLPKIKKQAPLELSADDLPKKVKNFSINQNLIKDWKIGEKKAHQILQNFVASSISHYQKNRDFPFIDETSRLSAYLAVGAINTRQCYYFISKNCSLKSNSVTTWLSEIIWREFYRYILIHFPKISKNQPFIDKTKKLTWNNNPDHFKKWCEGQTGFPIIDSAMNQLNQTGWMHNRLRMIVAMFLTKNLLIDWRLGEDYFMNHLIDGDLASNNGGWQWSASTGTDAVPYFRIFNPDSQAQRFDPSAQFIKKFLPTLKNIDSKKLIDSDKFTIDERKKVNYPEKICDLKATRKRAIEAFKKLS